MFARSGELPSQCVKRAEAAFALVLTVPSLDLVPPANGRYQNDARPWPRGRGHARVGSDMDARGRARRARGRVLVGADPGQLKVESDAQRQL
jgi:hypothetical protein